MDKICDRCRYLAIKAAQSALMPAFRPWPGEEDRWNEIEFCSVPCATAAFLMLRTELGRVSGEYHKFLMDQTNSTIQKYVLLPTEIERRET